MSKFEFLKISARLCATLLILATPVWADERLETLQNALSNAGCYSGSINGMMTQTTETAVACWQKKNGQTSDGYVTQEEIDQIIGGEFGKAALDAVRLPEPEPQPDPFETAVAQIKAALAAQGEQGRAAQDIQPPSYQQFGDESDRTLFRDVLEGRFPDRTAQTRTRAIHGYLELLRAQWQQVRNYGPDCVYPGDTFQEWVATREEWNRLYPGSYETTERGLSFYAPPGRAEHIGVLLGGTVDTVQDVLMGSRDMYPQMARFLRERGCRSVDNVLLRENLHRFLTSQAPMTRAEAELLYGSYVPPAESVSAEEPLPPDGIRFGLSCYGYTIYADRRRAEQRAYDCACMERVLRAADARHAYHLYERSWRDGFDQYYNDPVIEPISTACPDYRLQRADKDMAERILQRGPSVGAPMFR